MDVYGLVLTLAIVSSYLLGIYCSALAVLRSRTPQGAIAWTVSLLTMPFFSVPLYIVFGHTRFHGYFKKKRLISKISVNSQRDDEKLIFPEPSRPKSLHPLMRTLEGFCEPAFTPRNSISLLIDGREAYLEMMNELQEAKKYIIFQFYVFRVDSIGHAFADILMRKAREGIRVYFLYDQIGSLIPQEFIDDLKISGIKVSRFNPFGGKGRFQLNFRNHRKILIVDGVTAFTGGMNIGDDYLGLYPELGPWRDTQIKLQGPSVIALQKVQALDWQCCGDTPLEVDWKIQEVLNGHANVMVLPSGPADEKHSCLLTHIALINLARKRLWIASPYLVPPESLLDAIILAALRGVDVVVIIPDSSDAKLVMAASTIYVKRLLEHGVRVYRYDDGFMHQKVMVVDDVFSIVGSANLDNRSMFINFEVTIIARDDHFIKSTQEMFVKDLTKSHLLKIQEFDHLSLWQNLSARVANLVAPVL